MTDFKETPADPKTTSPLGPGETAPWDSRAMEQSSLEIPIVQKASKNRTLLPIILAALPAFALAVFVMFGSVRDHDRLIARAELELTYKIRMMSKQLDNNLNILSMILTYVAEHHANEEDWISYYINEEAYQVPLLQGIAIFNATGQKLFASKRFPDHIKDLQEIAPNSLTAHRDQWSIYHLSLPDFSRPLRHRTMTLSRSILSDEGQFVGVVVALFPNAAFMGNEATSRRSNLARQALFDNTGQVLSLCDCPGLPKVLPKEPKITDIPPFDTLSLDRLKAHGTQIKIDHNHIIALHQLRDFPFRLALAQKKDVIQNKWWVQNRISILSAFSIIILASAFIVLLARRQKKHLELEAEKAEDEKALRYQYALLVALRENSPEGVLMVDERGVPQLWNQRFIDFWDIPDHEKDTLEGPKIIDYINQKLAEPENFQKHIAYYMQNLDKREQATDVILTDGRILQRNSVGIRDPHIGYWGRIWFYDDVTKSRRHEETATKFGRMLDHSSNEVYLIDPSDFSIVQVNATALNRLGYRREDMVQKTIKDLEGARAVDDYRSYLAALLRGEKRVYFQTFHHCQDGSRYPVDVVLQYMAQESPPVLLAMALDATEKRKAAEALASQIAFQDTLIDTVPLPIFALEGASEKITTMNQAFESLFGYSREVVVEENAQDVFSEPLYKLISQDNERLRGNGGSLFYAGQALRADGKTIHALLFKAAYRDPHGRPAGIVGVILDQTEQRALQDQLEETVRELAESNRELEQFAYVASHDLQEPLRMVTNYMRLIEHRVADKLDEDSLEFIQFAADGARRMQALIQDLLNYSRVTTKGKDLTPVESSDCVEAALGNLGIAITEANADVHFQNLPMIQADVPQVIRLFQNLIGNAVKYRHADRAPYISISADQDPYHETFWRFSVEDNGIGFEQSQAERIFLIFQRLQTRENYEGTGIGLAICRRIIERHGGYIHAESQPDIGSRFIFTLPKIPDESAPFHD